MAKNRIKESLNGNGDSATAVAERPKRGDLKNAEAIVIQPIDIRNFEMGIRGTSPLIVQKFSEKARKSIKDKQEQKAKGGREKRDPHAEFLAALYVMPGTGAPGSKTAKYGIPAAGFKKAAVSACRYIDGINMRFASGAFHVLEDAGGLVQLKCSQPYMREDTVRLLGPSRPLDLRYRPQFDEWSCVLRIRYNASVISAEQIVNLFHHAGFHIGWGELRAEKGYSNGTFEVVTK